MHRLWSALATTALIAPCLLAAGAGSQPSTSTVLTSVEVLTDRLFAAPGSVMQGRVAKWKVSFQFGGGSGTPLTSGGGFEYGEESTETVTDEWTAAPGAHGLGQSMRYFRFELICAQRFLQTFDAVQFISEMQVSVDPCARTVLVTQVCRDTNVSQSVCDRTPCAAEGPGAEGLHRTSRGPHVGGSARKETSGIESCHTEASDLDPTFPVRWMRERRRSG